MQMYVRLGHFLQSSLLKEELVTIKGFELLNGYTPGGRCEPEKWDDEKSTNSLEE